MRKASDARRARLATWAISARTLFSYRETIIVTSIICYYSYYCYLLLLLLLLLPAWHALSHVGCWIRDVSDNHAAVDVLGFRTKCLLTDLEIQAFKADL